MRLRNESQPLGPVGFMLESAHLQGARIDEDGRFLQFNQPTIDILKDPYQDLKTLLKETFASNRTAAAEGVRKEHEGLFEVDRFATKGETGKMAEDAKLLLNIVRSGSMWIKSTGYWASHSDSKLCKLCGKEEETAEHSNWKCDFLCEARKNADAILAKIDF